MSFKEERLKLGISQKEFAEIIGVTPSAVCQWESGLTNPNSRVLKLLSLIFRLPVDELLSEYHSCNSDAPQKNANNKDSSPSQLEEWKKIEGFPVYSVSSFGNVRNDKTGRFLKAVLNNSGYYQVCLYNDKIRKNFCVHRLVASAFIENPSNYPMINHKDEVKTNNNASNLEWCDAYYNNTYGSRFDRIRYHLENRDGINLYDKVVCLCTQKGISIKKLCDDTHIHPKAIAKWNKNIPSILKAKKVADALGVTLDSFLH